MLCSHGWMALGGGSCVAYRVTLLEPLSSEGRTYVWDMRVLLPMGEMQDPVGKSRTHEDRAEGGLWGGMQGAYYPVVAHFETPGGRERNASREGLVRAGDRHPLAHLRVLAHPGHPVAGEGRQPPLQVHADAHEHCRG